MTVTVCPASIRNRVKTGWTLRIGCRPPERASRFISSSFSRFDFGGGGNRAGASETVPARALYRIMSAACGMGERRGQAWLPGSAGVPPAEAALAPRAR